MLTAARHRGFPEEARIRKTQRGGAVPGRSDHARAATAEPAGHDDALARARAGDAEAFATIVEQHQSMVFSLALHALRSRAAAEDLAQDVFLSLYRNLSRIESAAHAVAWLRRVASHRCIDELRRPRHRVELAAATAPDPPTTNRSRDPFLEGRLQQLVALLPPQARLVIVLRYQEDLDPSEIAHALSIPVNTVKSHLRRSLSVLRARLLEEGSR
jgi:RNA polymerase sigma-70 factor, ECF subfamily